MKMLSFMRLAVRPGVAGIVTRNARDFEKASLPVLSPEELLSAVLAEKPTEPTG